MRILRLAQMRAFLWEENAEEAGALLRGHRYTLFDAATAPGQRRPLDRPAWNTLALPA